MNPRLNYITAAANIAGDLLEPAWIQDSPRKQLSLVAEKSWSVVPSSLGVCETFAGWKANINNLKYQEVLAPLTFPTIKGVKFCSRMVLHRKLLSLHQSLSR
ncbi:hypothetical protein NL108_013185 [Boleophthalmus pectinirostris]|nr:hypothetical protein NL108_013185 [Boleophthalmus pectinirostris]